MIEPVYQAATRAGYDAVAAEYTELARVALAREPFARAALTAFAELVEGPVAELGCGPGMVSAFLHGLGVDVFGIDLSPAMVAIARREHPGLRFEVGTMTELDLPDGALGGIVAWYSIIHIPPAELPALFAGFHRVLRPGGHLQLAFQVGEGTLHLAEALGKQVGLDFHRGEPDRIGELLTAAGFEVRAVLRRARDPEERTPQAYLLARKVDHEAIATD
ncbi:class I SAM-dependent DNA methyltransferase [Crossiella cryophila]|uniref:SAM-dependent methyltransferase n=1 Tax=Crossiella cryophila TaxID=43355 RepID=A0A7W7FQ38_9PSEU|nr:class I SAM-dependent methyltransferase [Crossiella cryophila]MBB4674496.1 SAM-dependent methyltransferase [Crossiella cryophila]